MNKTEILRKAQSDEGMTVAEIKAYQKMVQPKPQVYGKYGTLKLQYLKDKGIDWTIADLPEYLHGIDRQAERLYETMYAKLSASEQYKKTGEFMKDLQIETEIKRRIEEEILTELIYVEGEKIWNVKKALPNGKESAFMKKSIRKNVKQSARYGERA